MSEKEGVRLYLVRHGNTFEAGEKSLQVGLKTDLALTSRGCEQASEMADYCVAAETIPSHIYSGSLQRQTRAAEIIGERLGLSSRLGTGVPALDEIDYGPWEGLSVDELESRHADTYAAWNDEGEWPKGVFQGSLEDRLALIEEFIVSIRSEFSAGESVLAVSSNGIIRLFQRCIPGRWETMRKEKSMHQLKVKTGNFCELRILPLSIEVVSWNTSPRP